MTWRVWAVLVVVFVLGFGRLWIEKRPDKPIGVEAARHIAQCLGPAKNIAANSNVTLVPAEEPKLALGFHTTSAVEIDIGPEGTAAANNVTVKDKAGFEFELSDGPAILKIGDDEFYIDATRKPRFGAQPKLPYLITLTEVPKTRTVDNRVIAILPPGTTGKAQLGAGLDLVTVQSVPAKSWLNRVKPTLLPVRAIGQQGLSDLSIDVRQGGIRFDDQGFVLDGCAWRVSASPASSNPVGVAEIKASGTGAAVARLTIPSTLIPAWPDNVLSPVVQIELVLASADGKYKAYGGFTAFPKLFAAAAALLIIGVGLWWLVHLRANEFSASMTSLAANLTAQGRANDAARATDTGNKARFASLFLGADYQPSLSLFQIFFWTLITVWGILYVYLTTGNLLAMTTSMMGLLGIAGVGSVIARWISPDAKPATNAGVVAVPDKPFEFWQILSTGGNFDLLKLQLLVFTLSIGAYVVWRIADTAAFPELDTNTLLLLGVSQGVYIGGKIAGSTALNRAQTLKVDIAAKQEARDNLAAKIAADTAIANGLAGQPKTDLEALIAGNQAKLDELKKAITAAEQDLAKAVKELGL